MNNDSQSTPKTPPTPTELSELLYPTPKTYDEIRAERHAARIMRRERQAENPNMLIAGIILGLVILAALLVFVLPRVLTFGMVASMLSIVFGVAYLGLVLSAIKKIRALLDIADE